MAISKTMNDEFLKNPEVGTAADKLIQTIKEHYKRIEGRVATSQDIKKCVTKVLENRL